MTGAEAEGCAIEESSNTLVLATRSVSEQTKRRCGSQARSSMIASEPE